MTFRSQEPPSQSQNSSKKSGPHFENNQHKLLLQNKKLRFGKILKRSCWKNEAKAQGRRSRVDNGSWLSSFLLPIAMKEHKTQRKQTKHQSVFLRFGDDLTIDDNSHRAFRIRRKPSGWSAGTEGSRKEIADGFVEWILHSRGVASALHYLDDFLLLGPPSTQVCQAALCSTLSICEELGLPVAPEKTEGHDRLPKGERLPKGK